jgi:hypothetical protein
MAEAENTPDPISRAFDEYVAAFRAGRGDPKPFLNRFEGRERRELDLLIEGFIATGPVSDPDPADPRVAAITGQVLDQLEVPATGLASLLTRLRQQAKLTQEAVVRAIADSIGASPAETEKIDVYYHRLEWGSLPPDGLSRNLFGTLTRVLGAKPDELEQAARAAGEPAGSSGLIFARAEEAIELSDDASVARGELPPMPAGDEDGQTEPDRIDELFTGG